MRAIKIILLFLIILLASFTIHENNRITIAEQYVLIDGLPEDLEGFTILQITDLHEKWFGDGQEKLLDAIHSVDYDAIVFTGDMLDDPESKNYAPFYTLIEGISNKEMAFFVPGNTDPESYILGESYPTERDAFIKGMELRGVQLLESVEKVDWGDSSLYFTYVENSLLHGGSREMEEELQRELSILDTLQDSDVLIGLNHYPLPDARIDELKVDDLYQFHNYDLIIAGHYHGGQIRLPLLGALFVPEPYYQWDGLFPPRDRVKGLWSYEDTKQYVSTGLGSSDAIPILKFRFLNPPEMNILVLTGK